MEANTPQDYIYILALENGKYYVGRTKNVENRYNEHLNGDGSEWTKKYKPTTILKTIICESNFDEDKYVLEHMLKFGVNNVRGGIYSTINLTDEQNRHIDTSFRGAKDLCFKCGKEGHFAKNCTYSKDNVRNTNNNDFDKKSKYIEPIFNNCNDEMLYNELIKWRRIIATKSNLPLHYILTNKVLVEIVIAKPVNDDELINVKGIGQKKLEDYGEDIINIVNSNTNKQPTTNADKNPKNIEPIFNNRDDEVLYNKLTQWRGIISTKIHLPLHSILTNKVLVEIVTTKPVNDDELINVKGIGQKKLEDYGEDIINIVNGNNNKQPATNADKNIEPIFNNRDDEVLYNKLTQWRGIISTKIHLPLHYILTNKVLVEIVTTKPVNLQQLINVKGIGQKKLEDYGEDIINIVNSNNNKPPTKNADENPKNTEPIFNNSNDELLYNKLIQWRGIISTKSHLPLHYILTNEVLVEIATTKPVNLQQLINIKGIGQKKLEDYGEDIVTIVNNHINPRKRDLPNPDNNSGCIIS